MRYVNWHIRGCGCVTGTGTCAGVGVSVGGLRVRVENIMLYNNF